MNLVAAYFTLRQLQRSQWLDRDSLRRLQEEKLRRLIDHAYRTVPYYRKRFDEAGIMPSAIRSLDDLHRIPVTSKADLQHAGPEAITSSACSPDRLILEHTSGSTGRPFTVRFDPHFVRVRNSLFLRALMTAGYRFGKKLMLITSTREKPPRRWLHWHYVSLEEAPARMVAELRRFRPWILYGCMTPLRQMALHIRAMGAASTHRPYAVVSTAEVLDRATRQLLEVSFEAKVYDVYGLTEMGIIAWECDRHEGYHCAEDTSIVEILPPTPGTDGSPIIMTNLELSATPLIRFQTGDLGVSGSAAPCACGRSLKRLQRIEGRSVDCIQLRHAGLVSPYKLTLAIEQIPGIERYQVIQEDYERFTLRYQGQGDENKIADAAYRAIAGIVGQDVQLRAQREMTLDPLPGGKFRVVECRIGGYPFMGG